MDTVSAMDQALRPDRRGWPAMFPAAGPSTHLALPPDALAGLAAGLLDAPVGLLSADGAVIGGHGLPSGQRPELAYAVSGHLNDAVTPVRVDDLLAAGRPELHTDDLVVRHGIRAVLGVPLRDDAGHLTGSLAVLDGQPRAWTAQQLATLLRVATAATAAVPAAPDARTDLDSASLLDGVQEAVLAMGESGQVVGWNRAAEDLFGASADELLDRPIQDLLDFQPTGQSPRRVLRLVLRAPPRWRPPRRMTARHRSGHRFATMVRLAVVDRPTGPVVCAFINDVSGQAAAEEEVERHRGFLDALVNNLEVGVAACDSRGRLVFMNPALRRAHGLPDDWSPEQGDALVAATLARPDGTAAAGTGPAMRRIVAGEEVRDLAVVIRAPGQRPRDFTVNGRPIIDTDGAQLGAMITVHDVTERRRADRFQHCQLRALRALTEAATAAQAAPVIVAAVADTLGWPHAELWLVDEVTDTLQVAAYWTAPGLRLDDLFGSAVVKGVGISGTVWATGEPLWVPDIADTPLLATPQARARAQACAARGLHTVLAVPITDGEQVLGVLTCFADTPEYDQAELTHHLGGIAAQVGQFLSRRRADELALQLARAHDDFVTLVGHEMRTPLTSIASYIELLLDADGRDDTEAQMLAAVARNTTALRAIIDDLMELAGLESGHLGITVRRVDLSAIVADAAGDAAAAITAAGVHLHQEWPATLVVDGDPVRLRQVADNVLANAVKYNTWDGDVTVRLRERGGAAELSVTDTGIGIPADERQHLFRRFYRAANARHSGIPGTGLGLTLVRAIVQAHHGTISVSHHQPGTTVTIRLPMAGRTDGGPADPAATDRAAADRAARDPAAAAGGAQG